MFRLFGIDIKAHFSLPIYLVLIILYDIIKQKPISVILFNLLAILTIFVLVTVHELGHCLVARKYNIPTKYITLTPIGGIALLENLNISPKQECWIAIAGPLVNIVLSIIALPFLWLPTNEFLWIFFIFNIVIGVFNLLPFIPLDGGRILRALLTKKFSYTKATEIGCRMGQGFSILLIILGILYSPIWIILAVFIFLGATGELLRVKGNY